MRGGCTKTIRTLRQYQYKRCQGRTGGYIHIYLHIHTVMIMQIMQFFITGRIRPPTLTKSLRNDTLLGHPVGNSALLKSSISSGADN